LHLINILRGQWQEKENKRISSLVSTQRVVPQTGVGGGQQLIDQANKADVITPLDQQQDLQGGCNDHRIAQELEIAMPHQSCMLLSENAVLI